MKYFSLPIVLLMGMVIAGCGTGVNGSSIDQDLLNEYEVNQKFEAVVEGDFHFRLASEKEVYEQGEEINLFAEIIYVGEEEEVTISHSEYPVYFSLHEKVRDFHINSLIREIGKNSTLTYNKPHRVNYTKQAVSSVGNESEAYLEFIEDFTGREDYPPGYYVVKATAMFHDGEAHREIEAEIDFKVEN